MKKHLTSVIRFKKSAQLKKKKLTSGKNLKVYLNLEIKFSYQKFIVHPVLFLWTFDVSCIKLHSIVSCMMRNPLLKAVKFLQVVSHTFPHLYPTLLDDFAHLSFNGILGSTELATPGSTTPIPLCCLVVPFIMKLRTIKQDV